MLHIVLNALTAEARFMQCNFKIDRYKFHSIGFVGFLTKKITTQVGFSPASLPVVIVKCPVIPYPVGKFLGLIKYIIFFPSHQKSKGDHSYSFQQINGGSKLCFSERHQDILSCNPLSFLTQNIISVVCRFSLDS